MKPMDAGDVVSLGQRIIDLAEEVKTNINQIVDLSIRVIQLEDRVEYLEGATDE